MSSVAAPERALVAATEPAAPVPWLLVLGALAILRRDAQVFWSYRLRLITRFLGTAFSLTLFYYISRLVKVSMFRSHDAYYAFAVVGLIILTVLNSTLATPPAAARQEQVSGTFERLAVSPFGVGAALISGMLFPLCFAMGMAIVSLTFAGVAFGLALHWSTVPLAIPLGLLGATAFMPFGVIVLAATIVVKQAAASTTWIIAGISLVAGLYFPVSLLPAGIRWLSDVQPFTPAVDLLRHVLVDTPLRESWLLSLGKLAGFSAIMMPLAVWLLGRGLEVGRRRGTLTEY